MLLLVVFSELIQSEKNSKDRVNLLVERNRASFDKSFSDNSDHIDTNTFLDIINATFRGVTGTITISFGWQDESIVEDTREKLHSQQSLETSLNNTSGICHFSILAMKEILQHGVTTTGVFRIGGNNIIIDEIFNQLDHDEPVHWEQVEIYNVGSILKTFFRNLSSPLWPPSAFPNIFKLEEDMTVENATQVIMELEDPHRMIFVYLLHFLGIFSTHQEVTKMTPQNLSICFAPTLFLFDNIDPLSLLTYTQSATTVYNFMIENSQQICEAFKPTWSGDESLQSFEEFIRPKDVMSTFIHTQIH